MKFLVLALLVPAFAQAQWAGQAGASLVNSSGNSSAGSLGVRLETSRSFSGWLASVDAGALRSSADSVRREAIGVPDDFEIVRTVTREVQADRTWARARVSSAESSDAPRPSWFGSLGWERDAPAGVAARLELAAGLGAAFGQASDDDDRPHYVGGGLALVGQRDEISDPETAGTTLGVRFDARSARTIGSLDVSVVSSGVWNLRNRDDLRLDAVASAGVPISEFLAFQPSLQALWDSRPSLVLVPLAPAVGAPAAGAVPTRRGRLDLILLASLTVRWGES